MSSGVGVVWFRRDLRLADNPAWARATSDHERVAAVFVLDEVPLAGAGPRRVGLLVSHLRALHEDLVAAGGGLHLLRGRPGEEIPGFAAAVGASALHLNADVGAYARRRDESVRRRLDTVRFVSHWGNHVHPPGTVAASSTGRVHRVFGPFHRAWRSTAPEPWPEPGAAELLAPLDAPAWPSATLGADHPGTAPVPQGGGERAAQRRLARWMDHVDDYPSTRDRPDLPEGTSHLSGDLRFGTLAARHVLEVVGDATEGREAFTRQLAWRDWYAHLVAANPGLLGESMDPRMDRVEWLDDEEGLEAWKRGMTGYPLVDAGMRELAATGWMHNRVRMVTASFLVKDLLVDWRAGEAHFRRELLDYEPSQNVGNWQWVAGTGPDAAPYFRVLNPTTQARRFDPRGGYIRHWVPELAELSDKGIHEPATVGPLELAAAGVTLGADYPEPIVEHGFARGRAIEAYERARGRG